MAIDRESADLARQARQHLESWRLAGLEWLPDIQPQSDARAAQPPSEPEDESSFFDQSPSKSDDVPIESLDVRRRELKVLAENVSQCRRCPELAATRTQTV